MGKDSKTELTLVVWPFSVGPLEQETPYVDVRYLDCWEGRANHHGGEIKSEQQDAPTTDRHRSNRTFAEPVVE